MSLYSPYTSEPELSSYHPDGTVDSYGFDNIAKLLEENVNRFLGIPKPLTLPEENDRPYGTQSTWQKQGVSP